MASVGSHAALARFFGYTSTDAAYSQEKCFEEEGSDAKSTATVGSLTELSLEEAVKDSGLTTWDKQVSSGITTWDKQVSSGITTWDRQVSSGITTWDKQVKDSGLRAWDKQVSSGITTWDKQVSSGLTTWDKQVSSGITTWDKQASGASTCLPHEDDFARAVSGTSEAGLDACEAGSKSATVDAACSQEEPAQGDGRACESATVVGTSPALSLEEALALQSELAEKYRDGEFQIKLFGIYFREDPRTSAYQQKLSALLRSARAEVLPKYGFSADDEGDADVAIALGEFHGDCELDALTACIDDLLYAGDRPMVEHSKNLSKRQILGICRAQVAAFKKPGFQAELAKSRLRFVATTPDGQEHLPSLPRCGELVLAVQRPILREHGLEPNKRGVHSLLHQVAQHIMDPEVAAYASAVNRLLGMDKSACGRFLERTREISVQDPCPRIAKPEVPPPRVRLPGLNDFGKEHVPSILQIPDQFFPCRSRRAC